MTESDAANLQPRWKRRPAGSTWGDFGPDDELGRLNLITPEKVLQGIAEVKVGRSFCLSLPLDVPGGAGIHPRRNAPILQPTSRNGKPNINYPLRRDDPRSIDIVSDDRVTLDLQFSTQWDALSHFGQMFDVFGDGRERDVYYNGFRAGDHIVGPLIYRDGEEIASDSPQGARHLGIEKMAEACVQGRAVMIDLEAHFGRSGTIVGYEELMAVLGQDKMVVEKGDLVCFRTGFARILLEMGDRPDADVLFKTTSALNGRDERLLNWITETELAAIAADNFGVEAFPALPHRGNDPCTMLPLHAHCLFKLGVHLGELWNLAELADWLRASERYRFLLTAPPLRLPGAVGSPLTPVGTV